MVSPNPWILIDGKRFQSGIGAGTFALLTRALRVTAPAGKKNPRRTGDKGGEEFRTYQRQRDNHLRA